MAPKLTLNAEGTSLERFALRALVSGLQSLLLTTSVKVRFGKPTVLETQRGEGYCALQQALGRAGL